MNGLLLYIRLILGILFLLSGTKQAFLDPVAEYQEFSEYMVPMWLFWPNALLKFCAGSALIFGLLLRPAAAFLAVFCTITAFVHVHMLTATPPLEMPSSWPNDIQTMLSGLHMQIIEGNVPHIFKDLGMSAGMLLIMLVGGGRYSLDQLFNLERFYPEKLQNQPLFKTQK